MAIRLEPGGKLFINSGDVRSPRAPPSEWILDETAWVIHEVAGSPVRTDDHERITKHGAHRDRVFLAPRPLEYLLP